jgi:hypothetical protein
MTTIYKVSKKLGKEISSEKKMKATVEHAFDGCYDNCPYYIDYGVLSPSYCMHPQFQHPKKIIGYSLKSCEIPEGKMHPDWCPAAKVEE